MELWSGTGEAGFWRSDSAGPIERFEVLREEATVGFLGGVEIKASRAPPDRQGLDDAPG